MLEFGKLKPMLCNLRVTKPADKDYIWEKKLDGFRAVAFVNADGSYRLQSRSLVDKTALFPELMFPTGASLILDGEITCSMDGKESFTAVQHRVNNPKDVNENVALFPATFNAFDILLCGQMKPTNHWPILERKLLLSTLEFQPGNVRVNGWSHDGIDMLSKSREERWEGVVGKNINEPYEFGKRRWVKIKTWLQESFQVIGFTPGTGKREHMFGSLVLSNGTQVGSGFTNSELMDMLKMLCDRKLRDQPKEGVTMVRPFSVKVKFVEYTNIGQLRFPIYVGLESMQ